MAQTKRKRQSKHRGNAAGSVVVRGRTGRKPTEQERKVTRKDDARTRRMARYERPPTWKGSLQRAGLATVMFVALVLIAFRQNVVAALAVAVVVVLPLYTALGYYTDLFIYRRRQKRKAAGAGR